MSSPNLRLDQGRRLVFNNRIDRVFNSMDPGGRYTPFMSGYRPQLFLRTADVTTALSFPEGTEGAAEKMVRRSRLILDHDLKLGIGHARGQCRNGVRPLFRFSYGCRLSASTILFYMNY